MSKNEEVLKFPKPEIKKEEDSGDDDD